MENIKISVIVPVYNAEKYLKKCLESILRQTLKEIELIIINDGSTDETLEILKNISDERIKVINQENKGVSYARNVGIVNSNGEYLIFIDSDDWIKDGYLADIYFEAKQKKLDLVISDYFYESGNQISYTKDIELDSKNIIDGRVYIERIFKENLEGFNWNKLIKRTLFLDNNIFYNENIGMMEDILILIRLSRKVNRIGKLNKAYYHYVQHGNSITKKITKNQLKSIEEVFEILKDEFKENLNILEFINEKEIYCLFWGFFNSQERISSQYFIRNYLKKIQEISKLQINGKKYQKILIKIIKLLPYRITIEIILKIYKIKKVIKK